MIPTNKIKCIIIDDEKEACDRLESILNKIPGLQVLTVETNPERGINEVVNLYPDIVFVDVEMPGTNGIEVVQEIKKRKVFPTFIFVTGYNQYAIKAIRNAAFDYLLKPVDIDELKEAINRFIKAREEKQKIILPEKLKTSYSLTDREIEIVKLLLEGKSSQEIAEILFISKRTVNTHRRNILEKTCAKTTNELSSLLRKLS
ncbi:MAG: response regulator transcription factor [Bacteroidetes bacterium]|nr:response regulator transcription factor [Bacteroidota bacterium]